MVLLLILLRVLLTLLLFTFRSILILILIPFDMKTKFAYLLHLAGSTAEKPVTSIVAVDTVVDLAIYITNEHLDVVQIQKLPDNIVII